MPAVSVESAAGFFHDTLDMSRLWLN